MDKFQTFRNCRTTIPLSLLNVSGQYTVPYGFYESPNAQNWMCELCTFSQIRSLMMVDTQPKHAFHSWVHKISQSGYVANVITYQQFKASTCLQIHK